MASTSAARSDVPPSFICPISLEVMTDPVTAADGHSYEHSEIKRWLQNSDLSPQTGALLPNKQLTRSHALRNAIEEFQAGQKKRAQQIQKLQQRVPASHSGVKVIYWATRTWARRHYCTG